MQDKGLLKGGLAALVAALALLLPAPAGAALIAQLGRCTPPVEHSLASVYKDTSKYGDWTQTGYGNDATHRLLEIDFAWAYDPATDANAGDAINATQRVEVCWVATDGAVHCPGWASANNPDGDHAWILFDRALGIGNAPAASAVKLAANPAGSSLAQAFSVPLDWDEGTYYKIAFLVVDAQQQPTSLNQVSNDIDAGGFCGVPFRLAKKQEGPGAPPADASVPGTVTASNIAFVSYGVPDTGFGAQLPAGWSHGDVCAGASNKAGFNAFDTDPCVDTGAIDFGLDRVKDVDDWQFNVVQGGPDLVAAGVQKHTWWNGTPGGFTTCNSSAPYCPSRVIPAQFSPPAGGAGYDWGGVYSETLWPYVTSPFPGSFSGSAEGMLRDAAHEYFHGLKETWKRFTGTSVLYDHGYVSEPTATTCEPAACVTNYPGSGTPALPATQCVSSHTLYQGYYTYGGLLSANSYLQAPENPFNSYPGALFYRYAAAQFAYPLNGSVPQEAHLPGLASVNSVSPVTYTESPAGSNNFIESQLKDRHPDEGMDLLGYYYAALDASGNAAVCNGANADVLSRLNCVLNTYVGRSLDDETLEFHTMLVLKDYADVVPGSSPAVETDPRWRLDWLGDYNAGDTTPIYSNANDPTLRAIRDEKPFLGPTSAAGKPVCTKPCCHFPQSPSDTLCDQLVRVHRVQDTYMCARSNPDDKCVPGTNVLVNTLVTGHTASSPHDVQIGAYGSAYVSMHPEAGYGKLEVHADVKSGSPRFRVFTIDASGVPTLASPCAQAPYGSEVCPVTNNAMDVTVPTVGVDEVLLVASAGGTPDTGASFSWRFGKAANALRIVSPLASEPAVIGQYDASGTLQTRPFVLYFTATDASDHPITGIAADNLEIFVNNQPLDAAGQCAPGAACPFTLYGGSGGAYMAVVNVPPSATFYPAGFSGREPLGIALFDGTADGDAAAQALEIRATPQQEATVLVIDTSGSMKESGKLPAAKLAAKLALDGMTDEDYAGLVLFSTHSLFLPPPEFPAGTGMVTLGETSTTAKSARDELKAAIDGITVGGSTSIGNGLFRAQDALDAPALSGTRPGVVLVSDGKNNCSWTPADYLLSDKSEDAPLATCQNCECNANTVPKTSPWPTDGSSTPYSHLHKLGYNARVASSLPVPFFTGVGVGQADMETIDQLAEATGGVSFWVPDPPPVQQLQMDFADGFRMAQDSLADYQRVETQRVRDIADLAPFRIDADTGALLVSILSVDAAAEPPGDVRLVDPAGNIVAPTNESPADAVFRLDSPAEGAWSFEAATPPPGASGSDPLLFAEIAVHANCRLFTRTTVDGSLSFPLEFGLSDDERWRGRDIILQASLDDGTVARSDAAVEATVSAPDGTERVVTLFDDGRHDDGGPGDGLFGARYRGTARALTDPSDPSVDDTYRVRYAGAAGLGSTPFCQRERVDSVTLHQAPDVDGDGLPDWWQHKYGLPTGSADADPDHDGLTNLQEFLDDTRPDTSDSDGGGESDLSEIAAGRDPRDPADDAIGKPVLVAVGGNGRVLLQPGIVIPAGMQLEIQSGPTRQGPFAPDTTVGPFSGDDVPVAAPNGSERCYTARLSGLGLESGWARSSCATPALDPVPPAVTDIALAGGASCAVRPVAELAIEAHDDLRDIALLGEETNTYDADAEVSGLDAMRISPATSSAPAAWQPFSELTSVDMGDNQLLTVVVRVRDVAGNQSPDAWVELERCSGTGLARSILDEEQALRLLAEGNVSEARSVIRQSLEELSQSLAVVDARVRTSSDPDHAVDAAVHADLSGARGNKKAALHAPAAKAADLVNRALEREYEAEELALSHGKAL